MKPIAIRALRHLFQADNVDQIGLLLLDSNRRDVLVLSIAVVKAVVIGLFLKPLPIEADFGKADFLEKIA